MIATNIEPFVTLPRSYKGYLKEAQNGKEHTYAQKREQKQFRL